VRQGGPLNNTPNREATVSEKTTRAPRNRTLVLTETDQQLYRSRLLRLGGPATLDEIMDRTICQDVFELLSCRAAA